MHGNTSAIARVPKPAAAAGMLYHPLFLYEIVWNRIRVGVILIVERKLALQRGRAFAVYLIRYGPGRSWLEAIRIDPTSESPLGIPANIWTSLIVVALGVTLFVVQFPAVTLN
jgi:prolipoprotein diacylglyceryltransferase